MKRDYKQPMMYSEIFTPNVAVAACSINKGVNWTFDCLRGPITDKATVVSSDLNTNGTCTKQVGYISGILTATNYDLDAGHSNNNPSIANWDDKNRNYITVTYTQGEGLLYANSDGNGNFNTNNWEIGSTSIIHNKPTNGRSDKHVMVAPVLDASSVNASW